MATEIGRTLSELDSNVKQLNASIKEAQGEAKTLDKNMQMNPASVDAVVKKYQNLQTQLTLTQQKSATLKAKMTQLTTEFNNGTISEQKYNKQLATVQTQYDKTENEVKRLTAALQQQDSAMNTAKMNQWGNTLDTLTAKTKKLSTASTALVAALAAVCASAISTGDELYDTATKYDTSVETLQIWDNRLTKCASDSEAYVNALSSIGTIQSAIMKNGGTRYATFLEQLGLSTEQLENVTKEEAFDMIFEGLQNIEDESTRATVAQGLFGDSGLDIATIAAMENEELQALDETFIENGIITTEQAAAADEAANKWAEVKQQFSAIAAELLESLMPIIERLMDFIENTILPILDTLCGWLGNLGDGGQTILLILLMALIFLPKVTKSLSSMTTGMGATTTATYAQATATGVLSKATAGLQPVLMIVAAALMIVIALMSVFSKSAKETLNECEEMMNAVDGVTDAVDGVESNVSASVSNYNSNSGTTTLDVNVDVNATGDTEISQANADSVAGAIEEWLTVDFLNQQLGAIVK